MRDQQEAPTDDFEIADPIAPNDDLDGTPGDAWEENTDDPADPDNGEEPFSSVG